MPTITLNKEVFERIVGKKLPIDKLKDRIGYLGTDLESIEGNEIIVEIFPNRPDLLSEQGFARAFSSFIGIKTGLRRYETKKSNERVIIDKSVKGIRPFTACAIVKGLDFDYEKIKEAIQIQEKLHITYGRNRKKVAIGIYPLEKIKMPIRFVAEDPSKMKFRPLESEYEMNGLQVLAKHPTGREYGHLLEGKSKFPFFIDANNKILSMPPIINSHDVGKITEQTKEVFIECSGFDYGVLSKCLNIIVAALADMGGEIYSMELDYLEENKKIISPNLAPEEMKIEINYVNKRLGLNLKESELKGLLERMGFGYENKKALIPPYRADILHPIDLVEDIAIAYGYENFEEIIPKVATIGEENEFERFISKIANFLTGFDMLEVSTYHLMSKDELTKKMKSNIEPIALANAPADYGCLRSFMLPSVIKVLGENRHNDYPQKIFDIGTVFLKDENEETGIKELKRLAAATISNETDYTEIKQILDSLMKHLDLKHEIEETEHESFISGRAGRAIADGRKIAYIGEINPEILEKWGIIFPVSAFEINMDELFEIMKNKQQNKQ